MRETRVSFIKNKCNIPLINIYLPNGVRAVAIVDSGSDSSAIDKQFVLDNKKEVLVSVSRNKIQYTGVHTTEEQAAVFAKTNVCLSEKKDQKYEVTFSVLDLSNACSMFANVYGITPSILIGSDFLSEHEAVVDYEKSIVIIKK